MSAVPFKLNGSSRWLLPRYRLCPSAWEGDGMVELPRSLPEFEARFPDEAACARWLLGKRWPDGFRGTVKLSAKGTGKRRSSLELRTYAAALAPVISAQIANACART